MNDRHGFDPLLASLARLPPASPGATRDARIRQRCYRVLDRHAEARAHERARRPVMARAADMMLAAALCAYAAMALLEASRLIH